MAAKRLIDIGTVAAGVAQTLEEQIRQGELLPGRALPPERDLATTLGVSRVTVRAAIKTLVDAGLLDHRAHHRPVVKHAEFRRATRREATKLGAWLWPNSTHFSGASILKGIQSVDLGPHAQVAVAGGSGTDWESILERERAFLDSMAEDPTALGVIVWYLGGERNLGGLQHLRERGVPIVFVDRLPPAGFDADYVGTNNTDSAYQGVRHLIGLGHRRIGMMSNIDPASSVSEREQGYRRALVEAGISIDPEWLQRATYDDIGGVASALETLLDGPEPPTAVFCVNDVLAFQVHDVANRMGLQVPEDLSIVGFDGLLGWTSNGGYLTTMRQDFEGIGRIAATLAQERASGTAPAANRHYLLDAPLITGATTAPPRFLSLASVNSGGLPSVSAVKGDS